MSPAVRTIMALDLYEVSAVAFPAYDDTTIGKRSLEEWRSAHPPEQPTADQSHEQTIPDPAAAPVSKAAHRARLKMDFDLKVRTTR